MTTTPQQEALPGAFLPDRAITAAATALCGEICGDGDGYCEGCRDLALTALLLGLAAIDPTLTDPGHVLIVGEDRWTLQHPLACRPNLADCAMHAEVAAELNDACLLDAGSYRVETRDGVLLIGGAPLHDEQEDEQEDEDDRDDQR